VTVPSEPPALPLFRVRSLDEEARCERLNSVATVALVVPLVIVGDMFWDQGDWLSVAMVGVPAMGNLFGVLIRERSVFPLVVKSSRQRKWRRPT
jgi:hypothetical protein